MKLRTLRAGLVGLGMMGRHHARVLRKLDDVELVGVCDQLGDVHGAAGSVPIHGSLDSLIAADIDICVVAIPTDGHLKAGLELAAAGVHFLIEKPLAATIDECDQLVDAADRAGVIACVGHIERFNPALQALRARLDQGELGALFQIATRRQGPFPNRVRDVGVVKDLGTHDVDLTAWVARSQFRAIGARTAHKTGRDHEDLVAATGMLTNGTITNHLVNWLSPMKERVVAVTGERGCLIADTLTADLTYWANGEIPTEWQAISVFRGVTEGDVVRYAIPKPEPLVTELEAFRDGVLDVRHDYVSLREGRAAVVVAEACLDSATSGTTVDLKIEN